MDSKDEGHFGSREASQGRMASLLERRQNVRLALMYLDSGRGPSEFTLVHPALASTGIKLELGGLPELLAINDRPQLKEAITRAREAIAMALGEYGDALDTVIEHEAVQLTMSPSAAALAKS